MNWFGYSNIASGLQSVKHALFEVGPCWRLTDLEEYRRKSSIYILVPTVLAETRCTEVAGFEPSFWVNVASQDLQGIGLKDVWKVWEACLDAGLCTVEF